MSYRGVHLIRFTSVLAALLAAQHCNGDREIDPADDGAFPRVPVPAITLPSPDPCGDLDAKACYDRAFRAWLERGPHQNPLRTRTLHEAACAKGYAPACAEAARLFELWGGINAPPDRRPPCEGKDGVDCQLVNDHPYALAYHERACVLGMMSECTAAGEGYMNGFGYLRKDLARAEALFQRACDAGDGRGCARLAWRRMKKQPDRALSLFERACDLGDLEACFDAAVSYASGSGTAKDPAKAVALYEKRCGDVPDTRCTPLADLYVQGLGTPRKPAKAALIYARACGSYKEDRDSCGKLGALHEKGDGVPKDVAKAIEVYRRGCGVYDRVSCDALDRLGVAH